jgi:hypothetical protein
MGKHNRSVMVAVHGTPCAIPSRNSKNKSNIADEWGYPAISGSNLVYSPAILELFVVFTGFKLGHGRFL